MNIADIERRSRTQDCGSLLDMEKYARTIDFQRKVDDAMRTLDNFYRITKNPVISCGGGKDGTAVALLSIRIGSNAPIVCADPPNPLPDREQHKSALRDYLGVGGSAVPYEGDGKPEQVGQPCCPGEDLQDTGWPALPADCKVDGAGQHLPRPPHGSADKSSIRENGRSRRF